MRIVTIIFLLLSQICFCQVTKIKIKKADPLYKATIAGVDTGIVSLKKINALQQLSVTNEKDGIKVFSYEAFIVKGDNAVDEKPFTGKNKKLSEDLIKKLEEAFKEGPTTLRIKNILAYNAFNETIELNDIEVEISR
jgi:hypothetical protein